MTSTFTSYPQKDVSIAASTLRTVPASTVVILISAYISNTIGSLFYADLYVTRGGVNYYLAKTIPVPIGGALVPISAGKVVLIAADVLKVAASVNSAGDAWVSVLEKA